MEGTERTVEELVEEYRTAEGNYPWCVKCHRQMLRWFTNPNNEDEHIYICPACYQYPIEYYNRFYALPGPLTRDYEQAYVNMVAILRQWSKMVWRMRLYDQEYAECITFDFRV